ncbi:hypothetical protein ES703_71398 [subsurface metagenome]
MQQTVEIPLGTIKAYGTVSGYIYLHIPNFIAKHFNISASTYFSVFYRDDKVVIEQKKEK